MSLTQVTPIALPQEGETHQILPRMYIRNENEEISIVIDSDGRPDRRFNDDGLGAEGLGVVVIEMAHFPGEQHPPLRRPIIIRSDDRFTLMQLAEGISLLEDPSDFDDIVGRIKETLATLSEVNDDDGSDDFIEAVGFLGELYTLRDAIRECVSEDQVDSVLDSASFLSDHVHDWESADGPPIDVKTTIKTELEIFVSSREQLATETLGASFVIISLRRCGENSDGAMSLRSLVSDIEHEMSSEQSARFRTSDKVSSMLSSSYLDSHFAIRTSRPPSAILVSEIPDRELLLEMDWERHPGLCKPIILAGHAAVNANAYGAAVDSLVPGVTE